MRPWISGLVAAGIGSAAVLAVGSGGVGAASWPHGGVVTYIDAPMSPFADNFNPFSASDAASQASIAMYEPLLYFNTYTEKAEPKLATAYRYSDGGKVITFTLRRGVQWSDGRPFTSADVQFTYDEILKYPAIDLSGVRTDLASVQAVGPYTVRFTLKRPDGPFLYYLAGDVPIVPKHIWQHENPVMWTNPNPVTTGPFLLGKFSPSLLILKANPHYWDKPEPYISEIRIPVYLSNTTAALAMAQGNWTVGQQFIPNIKTSLLDKNPHYGDWFPPVGTVTLFPNDKVYPMNLLAFRRAISAGINRALMSRIGEYGYNLPVNATGLPLPTFRAWVPQSLLRAYPDTYAPAKARQYLRQGGFTWTPSGQLLAPDGKPVTLTILAPAGATDAVADANIMVQELRQLGMNVVLQTPAFNTEMADLADGNFQLAYMYPQYGTAPGPYYIYNLLFGSAYTAPEGKTALSNYERWTNPTTDRLLAAYASAKTFQAQKAIMVQLERQVASQLPVIPVLGFPAWEEYNTTQIVGWPTPQDPYACLSGLDDYMYVLAQVHER